MDISLQPLIHAKRKGSINNVINFIFQYVTPSSVTLFTYRVGTQNVHTLKFDKDFELTLLDGQEDIPSNTQCLEGLQQGHLKIGVLDSIDITYTIAQVKTKCHAQRQING
ncbi:hypothetical protein [Vibrio owensii]|uniref:hypothetical protein n=1 Tax=Vibrio owensii TaxID=696485 RepID=UPI0018F1B505|nr:hypothetical protein [Vibrio owensii]